MKPTTEQALALYTTQLEIWIRSRHYVPGERMPDPRLYHLTGETGEFLAAAARKKVLDDAKTAYRNAWVTHRRVHGTRSEAPEPKFRTFNLTAEEAALVQREALKELEAACLGTGL